MTQVAEVSGVNRSTISRWLSGQRSITVKQAMQILKSLGITRITIIIS